MSSDASLPGPESLGEVVVLHVDDDPAQTDLTADYLEAEAASISVRQAHSGAAALDVLDDERVDCIVSDYQMPGMDGLELLEAVRDSHPDLPFILFTGKGSEEIASDAISAGVTDYLQKGTGREQYELLANRILNTVEAARSERRLDRSQAHLRQAQELANVGSWQIDIPSGDLHWSTEVYHIFGLPAGEPVTYEVFLEYVHPDDRETVTEAWSAALEGETYDIEHRIVTEGGETRWVRERADIEFQDGEPVTGLGVVQDITEYKEREQELRRFREAVECAGHSIYVTDPEGEILYVNPAFEETTGYSREEALGANPRILKSGEHGEDFYRRLWDTIHAGDVWRSQLINETKTGERYVVDQTIAPVTDDSGEIESFVAVNADVTSEQAERETIEREREEYRRMLSAAPVPMLLADGRTGVIREANEAAGDLFEQDPEALVGTHQSDLHPDPERYEEAFRRHIDMAEESSGGRATRLELDDGSPMEIVTAEGERRRVAISATPVDLPSGRSFLGVFIDLSGEDTPVPDPA